LMRMDNTFTHQVQVLNISNGW